MVGQFFPAKLFLVVLVVGVRLGLELRGRHLGGGFVQVGLLLGVEQAVLAAGVQQHEVLGDDRDLFLADDVLALLEAAQLLRVDSRALFFLLFLGLHPGLVEVEHSR